MLISNIYEFSFAVKDQAGRLTKELASLQAEADRVARLLKIADPSGEGARNWESEAKGSTQSLAVDNIVESRLRLRARKESARELASQIVESEKIERNSEATKPTSNVGVNLDQGAVTVESEEVPSLLPPLLLGAPRLESAKIETSGGHMSLERETEIGSEFVGYLDRKKSKVVPEEDTIMQVEERLSEGLLGEGRDGGNAALEAIALILKHNSGLSSQGGAGGQESQTSTGQGEKKARGKKKRKLGAERPPLLVNEYESEEAWVPPEGGSFTRFSRFSRLNIMTWFPACSHIIYRYNCMFQEKLTLTKVVPYEDQDLAAFFTRPCAP